ncbi:MAG TPA: hypothetical protein P5571_02735 [Candidatus Krumholzibacteria bacterium]|nr:hypothetical protein [Candidatus Krumholzibacteria bacterium]HRX50259.1 hypothetical protein [Candidatus Krumholzibacteria bacterium]
MATIGIRLEDKNRWERRVPLTPADAAEVAAASGHRLLIQPSHTRIFPDDAYRAAGLEVTDEAVVADVLIAVKEIPAVLFRPGGVYVCFSHTIKGQPYNMPMLQRLLDLGATLVDYERIVDAQGRRLIYFSLHAGYAGMLESLRALGLRLRARGRETALADVKPAYEYADLADAEAHLRGIGARLAAEGGRPLSIGVAGYGNVGRGAQTVLSWLPTTAVDPDELPARAAAETGPAPLLVTVFREEHMVRPRGDHPFVLQDYFDNPERYEGRFHEHLPHLDLLVNSIYWTERYPRLITKAWVREAFAGGAEPRLQVVGDISIDIEGSVEISLKATRPDEPCYVYDPDTDAGADGVTGRGIVVMGVDNLPCELPREASEHFSSVFKGMVAPLGDCDWSAPYAELDLPPHLKSAVICHGGGLAPQFARLAEPLARHGGGPR